MATRFNVLYFIPAFGTGGTERLVADWVTHLDSSRFRLSVCTQLDGLFGETLARRGYPVHILGEQTNGRRPGVRGKVTGLVGRVARLRALLRREAIDIVHTHHLGPLLHAFLAGLPSRRWRWVHTEHIRPDVDIGYATWLERIGRRIVSAPDVVTGVSDAVGAYLRESAGVPAGRVKVIYNGVDVDRFAGPYDGAAKRRELRIPADAWVIGLVANLRPQKNHELLLRAFARVRPAVPAARLVLVGDGERRAGLERLAAELGVGEHVQFLGSRLDVPELYATFDVYCLPSHYEGMPLTVFEAMAAGRPIVATSVVGIREVIAPGETGLLVPPDDAGALAQAFVRLRREAALAEELASAALRYVDKHARLEGMVGQYAALYERVLAG